jgi:AbrB family looped-hinge helix DNA binding protein
MNAILSEKGQVTIPKKIRDRLGLDKGAILDFTEESGRIVVRKVLSTDPISKWRGRGRLPHAKSVDDYLRVARGEP